MPDAIGQVKVERKLAAIVVADVVGYSRLMGTDEAGTLARLKAHRRELIDPKIAEHGGRIIKTTGDGMLIEFTSVVGALRWAVEAQRGMVERNAKVAEEKRIVFRVGINLGDVIVEDDDIHGDGVNVAARLESIAEPGGISISDDVYRQVQGKLDEAFDYIGEQQLKNIAQPLRVYRVRLARSAAKPRPALALPDKPSIAVLPFQNMSGDPEQEYFTDGMVEEIITALSRFPSLFVIARNSSFTYKGKAVDIKQVGRELGVRYVLEGSVRKSGNRVRITGQLIQADAGAHIWGERYDGDLADVFELQDRIASSVVGAVAPSLEKAEVERAQRKPPENTAAYDLYLQALPHHYAMTREGSDTGILLLKRAITLDQRFAPALREMAHLLATRLYQGWSSGSDIRAEAVRYARMAVALDKNDPEALVQLAWDIAWLNGQHVEAISLSEKALGLNPNSASCCRHSGWVHLFAGQPETAISHFECASRLSPRDPMDYAIWAGIALAFIQLERDQDAIAAARKAVQRGPTHIPSWRALAAALALAGYIEEARATMRHYLNLAPDATLSKWKALIKFTDEARSRIEGGLRTAGMPE
jgi:adenylate cyclase